MLSAWLAILHSFCARWHLAENWQLVQLERQGPRAHTLTLKRRLSQRAGQVRGALPPTEGLDPRTLEWMRPPAPRGRTERSSIIAEMPSRDGGGRSLSTLGRGRGGLGIRPASHRRPPSSSSNMSWNQRSTQGPGTDWWSQMRWDPNATNGVEVNELLGQTERSCIQSVWQPQSLSC